MLSEPLEKALFSYIFREDPDKIKPYVGPQILPIKCRKLIFAI